MSIKLTLEEIKKRSIKNGFEFLDKKYINFDHKHNFKCLKHNKIGLVTFNQIHRTLSMFCCKRDKLSKFHFHSEDYIKKELRKRKYILLQKYVGIKQKHKIKCCKHNFVGIMSLDSFLNKNNDLQCCHLEKMRGKLQTPLKTIKKKCKNFGFIFLDKIYLNCKHNHNLLCLKHNKQYKSSMINIFRGGGLHCCGIDKITGENSKQWNPKLTEKDRVGNRIKGIHTWKKLVKLKDNNICQVCKSNKNIHTHHLESYGNNKKLRLDVKNGICMDMNCHINFHKKYGFGNNTRKQYNEFKKQYGVL